MKDIMSSAKKKMDRKRGETKDVTINHMKRGRREKQGRGAKRGKWKGREPQIKGESNLSNFLKGVEEEGRSSNKQRQSTDSLVNIRRKRKERAKQIKRETQEGRSKRTKAKHD